MSELDVELSRTVADRVARRRGVRLERTTTGTMLAAWALLLTAVVVVLVR